MNQLELPKKGPSLNDVLGRCDFTTRKSKYDGRKEILAAGEVVFEGTAGEAWEWLEEMGFWPR